MSRITDGFGITKDSYTRSEFNELLTHARALEAMLRKHQFDKIDYHGDDVCIHCGWTGHGDHSPDCELKGLLE